MNIFKLQALKAL